MLPRFGLTALVAVMLLGVARALVRPHATYVADPNYETTKRRLLYALPIGSRRSEVCHYLDYYGLRYLTWRQHFGLDEPRYDWDHAIEAPLQTQYPNDYHKSGPRAVFTFDANDRLVDLCVDGGGGGATFCV